MIHPPKRILSYEGLGLNTVKEMQFLSDSLAIGREVWGKLEMPWQEGDVIIADEGYQWQTRWEVGRPYIITKFYDIRSREIGTYCDVARPVERLPNGFAFDDLYLDVWQPFGEKAVLLDEDELAQALGTGHITQAEAEAAYVASSELLAILNSGTIHLDSLYS